MSIMYVKRELVASFFAWLGWLALSLSAAGHLFKVHASPEKSKKPGVTVTPLFGARSISGCTSTMHVLWRYLWLCRSVCHMSDFYSSSGMFTSLRGKYLLRMVKSGDGLVCTSVNGCVSYIRVNEMIVQRLYPRYYLVDMARWTSRCE